MGLVLLPTREADVVNGIDNVLTDVAIVLWGGLSADIGTGAHNGLLKAVAQLMRERLACDAKGDAPVFGNKVRSQVHRLVEDDGGRLGRQLHDVPCHVGHVPDVTLQTRIAVNQTNQRFRVIALL